MSRARWRHRALSRYLSRRLTRVLLWGFQWPVATGQRSQTRCFEQQLTTCSVESRRPVAGRLAVLAVGLKARFQYIPTLRHVVAPARRAGYEVDFYAVLGLTPPTFHAYWYRPVPSPVMSNMSADELKERVIRHAFAYGAQHATVIVQPEDVPIEEPPPGWNRWLGRGSWHDTALKNHLRVRKQLEVAWNYTLGPMSQALGAYTHVLFQRDDAYWVDDLDMSRFPDTAAIYSTRFGVLCSNRYDPDRYHLPANMVLMLGGRIAGRFLATGYTEFYLNPSPTLDAVGHIEEFTLELARLQGIPWRFVPQHWMPRFESMYTLQPGWEEPAICFRGLTAAIFDAATEECVPRAKVHHPFCNDFPPL